MRKIYRDFLKRKVRAEGYGCLLRLGRQYVLTLMSHAVERPLCGPILGTLVTNYACNLRCRMCPMPGRDAALRARGLRDLPTEGMLAIVDGFAELGARGIGFTGGEPLLRPDLFRLLRHARDRGLLVHLNTNGTLLDGEKMRALLEAGVESLNVSLDGATAASHDRVRGVPGAFERTTEAVRRLDRLRKDAGSPLRLKIVAVLSEDNIGEAAALLRVAAELGVDCAEFIPRQPFPEGEGGAPDPSPEFLREAEAAVRLLRDRASLPLPLENSGGMLSLLVPSFRGEPSPLPCLAGYNSLAVDSFGRVFPCVPYVNWDRPAGRIEGRGGLRAFWYSREYASARREVSRCRGCTLNCQAELNLLFRPWRAFG